jgi:hypothetical protein
MEGIEERNDEMLLKLSRSTKSLFCTFQEAYEKLVFPKN